MQDKKIVILGTGGTIAGTAHSALDNIGYTAAQVGVAQLVHSIPGLANAGPVVTEQVAQIDSKDLSFEVWAQLLERVNHFLLQDDVQGLVITHGTDTLEETAYFLHAVLHAHKPVVLTCAMRPATSLLSDGPQNLRDAVAVARHPSSRGVMVVCAGVVHGAVEVQKIHTYQLNAFGSGDAGPLAYVEEGDVRWIRINALANGDKGSSAIKYIAKCRDSDAWPTVEIVMSHAGASGAVVNALVAGGVQGLVVAGTGNGTVHRDLEAALLAAQARGVRVVRATRCPNGRVLANVDDAWEDSRGLSPVKARIALMLDLMAPDLV